jgi:enoyl-CoA hydratase/carnithine racemase
MRTPVIAAINGAAIGAGLTIALLTDVRYVASDAKLRFPFTRLNLVPEANATWLVPRLVGLSRALELLLSGRFFSGEEAANMGMASRALPAREVLGAAMELAREIAINCAPVATGLTKQLVHRSLEEPDRDKACRVETRLASWTGSLPDTLPGLMAFRAGREPTFGCSKHEEPPAEIDPMRALGNA